MKFISKVLGRLLPEPELSPLEALAVRAMELQARNKQSRMVYGVLIHSRFLRAPVHCASCHTLYEGDADACPSCTSTHALGPITELSMQIAKIREAQAGAA